jgi:hypothetical protein
VLGNSSIKSFEVIEIIASMESVQDAHRRQELVQIILDINNPTGQTDRLTRESILFMDLQRDHITYLVDDRRFPTTCCILYMVFLVVIEDSGFNLIL